MPCCLLRTVAVFVALLHLSDAVPHNTAYNKKKIDREDGEEGPMIPATSEMPADGVVGEAPAKFDDTAAAKVFSKPEHGGLDIEKLASKGFHLQVPRPQGSRPTKKHGPGSKRWANKDPIKDAKSMKSAGMSEDDITSKIIHDKKAYESSIGWMKDMEHTIHMLSRKVAEEQKEKANRATGKKPKKLGVAERDRNRKVEGLDGFIANEMETMEKETGQAQRAGSVFKALDTDRNGVLEISDAPAVAELLKKFGLESKGVRFDAFKQGVRAHRMRAKKAVLAAKKAQAAMTSVDAAQAYKPKPKKMAETPVEHLRQKPGTLPKQTPLHMATVPRPEAGTN